MENFLLFLELIFLSVFLNMYVLYRKMFKRTANKEKIEFLVKYRLAFVGIIFYAIFILYDIFFDINYPDLGVLSALIADIITITMGIIIYRVFLWVELQKQNNEGK